LLFHGRGKSSESGEKSGLSAVAQPSHEKEKGGKKKREIRTLAEFVGLLATTIGTSLGKGCGNKQLAQQHRQIKGEEKTFV